MPAYLGFITLTCDHCQGNFEILVQRHNNWKHRGCKNLFCSPECANAFQLAESGRNHIERFWSRVNKTPGLGPKGDCWEWIGYLSRGYGRYTVSGKNWQAHVYSYYIETGTLINNKESPDFVYMRHSCDNRACVNPNHLTPGPPAANSQDMVDRKRQAFGSRNTNSKLTDNIVRTVRALNALDMKKYNHAYLGRIFGVSQTAINSAIRRQTWRHVA